MPADLADLMQRIFGQAVQVTEIMPVHGGDINAS